MHRRALLWFASAIPISFKIAALEKTIAFPVETVLYPSDARRLFFVLLLALVAGTDAVIYGRRGDG